MSTGDIICTADGGEKFISGQFWRAIGKLIPGDVDHIVIYTGPGGRCVEAGPSGVVAFEAVSSWDAESMADERSGLLDIFYGAANPVEGRGLDEGTKKTLRLKAANYCLRQAAGRKPYNFNFLDSRTEKAFYCSQLAYRAYLPEIDLNTGRGVREFPGTSSIIFPQEIWEGCASSRAR